MVSSNWNANSNTMRNYISTALEFLLGPILGRAGIAFTSFTAACMVLCFTFEAKTVLITQQCFGCC